MLPGITQPQEFQTFSSNSVEVKGRIYDLGLGHHVNQQQQQRGVEWRMLLLVSTSVFF